MFHRWLAKPKWLVFLPLMAVLIIAMACGADATATPVPTAAPAATAVPEPEIIKIGQIAALTGAGTAWGIAEVENAQMAVERIKAEGGLLVGGKRYNFEMITEDAPYSEPDRAKTAATKLVHRDKVRFIRSTGDPQDSAASTVAEPEKVIIFGQSGNPHVYGAKDYMFSCFSPSVDFMDVYFSGLVEQNPDWNSFVYIQYNVNWDQDAVVVAERVLVDKLGKEMSIVVADQQLVDYTPTVTAALAKNADVVIIGQAIGDAPAIIRSVRELGWEGPMIAAVTTFHPLPEILKGLEGVEHYVEDFSQVDFAHYPPTAAAQKFIDEYTARKGEFNGTAFASWLVMPIFFAALQAAGTVDDPDKIMAAFEKIELEYPFYDGNYRATVGGKEKYGKDRICETPQALSVIRNGEPVTLEIIKPSIP